jgi:hypothetical protein
MNQREETVAVYMILTLVRRLSGAGTPDTRPELERAMRTEAPAALTGPAVMQQTQPGDAPARVA